jgi:hypothetical protein
MACGCNKSKSATTTSTQKKVDTSAAQKKVAQNLPLVTVKPSTTNIPAARKISKRQ